MTAYQIPTIDVSPLWKPDADEKSKLDVAAQLTKACEVVGFFKIVGHPIPRETLDQLMEEAYRFFSLPSEEKMQFAPKKWNPNNTNTYRGYFPASVNGKEGLDMGTPKLKDDDPVMKQQKPLHEVTVWPNPNMIPGWQQFMTKYYDMMTNLGKLLLEAIATGIQIDPKYFSEKVTDNTLSTLRLNFYPLSTNIKDFKPVAMGDDGVPLSCEVHTDGCMLTLLYQPEVGGLQVDTGNGKWVEMEPTPGAFVVNTGLCLQRWTNDRFTASNHRVRLLTQQRVSVPFFLEPEYDAVMELVVRNGEEKKYPTVTYGEYITEANKRFKEYQRDDNV
mmetsp:Transcript_5807/g.8129  ORF Transcript_5807/g.8129 Transcript_5807/m.8129 type:complete len:331 (-) Transcript_5807:75-1067(-)